MPSRVKQFLNSIFPLDSYIQLSSYDVANKYFKNGLPVDKEFFERHAGIELLSRTERKSFPGEIRKYCVIRRAVLDYQKSCTWLTAAGLIACYYDQKILAAICALTVAKLGWEWKINRQDQPAILAPPIIPDHPPQSFNAEDYLSDEQFYDYMRSIPDEIDQFPKSYPSDGSTSGSRYD